MAQRRIIEDLTPHRRSPWTAPQPGKPTIISIEGNIGIGKSTLIASLRKRFASNPRVTFVDEPVDLWEQHGLLQAMYSGDLERCAFQQMALITRAAALQKALATDATLIITERSLESDRACFAQINLTKPCEVAAYAVTHDAVTSTFPPARHATILLEAPIAVTSERIRLRGRNAETQDEDGEAGVPDEYLQLLQDAHEAYLESLPAAQKRVVRATSAPEAVADEVFKTIVELEKAEPTSPTSVVDAMAVC